MSSCLSLCGAELAIATGDWGPDATLSEEAGRLGGLGRSLNDASLGTAYSEIVYYKLAFVRNSKAFLTGAHHSPIQIIKTAI